MLVVLTYALASFAFSQTDESSAASRAGISGTYTFGHRFGGFSLTLAEDGTYSSEASDCTTVYTEQGSYTLTNNTLTLTVRTSATRPPSSPEDAARTNSENNTNESDTNTPANDTVRRLMIVRWGARLYLIEECDLLTFNSAINAGEEPREAGQVESYSGTFYLRVGDEEKSVTGIPELPETWRGCAGQGGQRKNP